MELKTTFRALALFFSAVSWVCFGQSAGVVNVTVSFSASPTFTATAGVTNFDLTLTGNVTSSTFSSPAVVAGSFKLCQDGTGGRTFAWPSGALGFGTIDATASKCSRQPFKWDGAVLQATGAMSTDGSAPGGIPGLGTAASQASGAFAPATAGSVPLKGNGAGGTTPATAADMVALWTTCTGLLRNTAVCLPVVTVLGSPGVDTNIPTEKAVRDAILAGVGGTMGSVTIAGTSNQITVTGTCTGTTTISCTLSLPSVLSLPGTINKVTITQPATGSTLTLVDGKTLTVGNTLTLTGTDGSSVAFGAGGTVVYSTDSRLSDSRTPTAHATSHKNGGADEVATATPAANVIPKTGSGGTLAIGFVATGTPNGAKFVRDDGVLAIPPGSGSGPSYTTVTFSATPTFTVASASTIQVFTITLTADVTSSSLAVGSAVAGQDITFNVCQDGAGGHAFAWPSNVTGAAVVNTQLSTCSRQTFRFDGTNAVAVTPMSCPACSPAITIPGTTSGNMTIVAPATGVGTVTGPAGTTTLVGKDTTDVLTNKTLDVSGAGNVVKLSAVNPQTATYQVLAADFSGYKTITVASGTFTITLVASGSQPPNGQSISIQNYGSGVITIARSGQNINGGTASLTLAAGSATAPTAATIISDGTNYFARLSGTSSGGGGSVFTGSTASTISSSATPAFSFADVSVKSPTVFKFTPIVNVTAPTFTNLSAGARALLYITTDGTHTWNWNSTIADNACNVWTASAGTTIAEVFVDPDGTTLHGGACIGGPTGLLSLVTEGTPCTSNPASGVLCVEANSTDHTIKAKDASGNVYVLPRSAGARTANQFATHMPGTGILATAAIVQADLPITTIAQKFFVTAPPGSIAGNLPGDHATDSTNHHEYTCNAPAGTAAPACTAVATAGWLQLDNSTGAAVTSFNTRTGAVTGAAGDIPETVNAQTGTTYTVVAGDAGKTVTLSNAASIAVTLPQAGGSFPAGWSATLSSIGAGTVTVTPTTSTIGGAATITLEIGEWAKVTSDGTNYQVRTNRITAGSNVTLTKSRAGGVAVAAATPIHGISFSLDGGGSAITAGQYQVAQAGNWDCSIIGWTIKAAASTSISIDLDAKASSAPPSAPAIPNTTTDKISASAPIVLSSAQSASGGASEVSTWTTSRVAYDSFAFNVTGTPTATFVTGTVWCQ